MTVTVGTLLRDPRRRDTGLALEVVLLRRDHGDVLCPGDDMALEIGDRVLLAGRVGAARLVGAALENDRVLEYLMTGSASQHGWIWQRLDNLLRDY